MKDEKITYPRTPSKKNSEMSEKLSGGRVDLHNQSNQLKMVSFLWVFRIEAKKVPVEEERREENKCCKSVGVEDEGEIGHSGGHGFFANYH